MKDPVKHALQGAIQDREAGHFSAEEMQNIEYAVKKLHLRYQIQDSLVSTAKSGLQLSMVIAGIAGVGYAAYTYLPIDSWLGCNTDETNLDTNETKLSKRVYCAQEKMHNFSKNLLRISGMSPKD